MPELSVATGYRLQPQVFQPINPASYFNRELPVQPAVPVDNAAKAQVAGALVRTLGELPGQLVKSYEDGKLKARQEKKLKRAEAREELEDQDDATRRKAQADLRIKMADAEKNKSPALYDFKVDSKGDVSYAPEDPEIRSLKKTYYERTRGGTTKPSLHQRELEGFADPKSATAPAATSATSGASDFTTWVKGMEGWNPKAYTDSGQTSIGYGTRGNPGEVIDEAEGQRRLAAELGTHSSRVDELAAKYGVKLTPYQREALTSFDFNTGAVNRIFEVAAKDGALNPAAAVSKMSEYRHADASKKDGVLQGRRQKEIERFMMADAAPNSPAVAASGAHPQITMSAEEVANVEAMIRRSSGGDEAKVKATLAQLFPPQAQSPAANDTEAIAPTADDLEDPEAARAEFEAESPDADFGSAESVEMSAVQPSEVDPAIRAQIERSAQYVGAQIPGISDFEKGVSVNGAPVAGSIKPVPLAEFSLSGSEEPAKPIPGLEEPSFVLNGSEVSSGVKFGPAGVVPRRLLRPAGASPKANSTPRSIEPIPGLNDDPEIRRALPYKSTDRQYIDWFSSQSPGNGVAPHEKAGWPTNGETPSASVNGAPVANVPPEPAIPGLDVPPTAAQSNAPAGVKFGPVGVTPAEMAKQGKEPAQAAAKSEALPANATRPLDAFVTPEIRKALPVIGKSVNQLTGEIYIRGQNGTVKTLDPTSKIVTMDMPDGRRFQLLPNVDAKWEKVDVPEEDLDIPIVGEAMIKGTFPPDFKGTYKKTLQLKAYLAKRGFDLTQAESDYAAVKRSIQTQNGTKIQSLVGQIRTAHDSLNKVEELGRKWAKGTWMGGRFPILNTAQLRLAKEGAFGAEAQSLAQQLDAQIHDVSVEVAGVFKGGNAPTDKTLEYAAENLRANFSEKTLVDTLELLRHNLRIRQHVISNLPSLSTGGDERVNPYDQRTRPSGEHAPAGGTQPLPSSAPAVSATPVTVNSQSEYDKLPSGTKYQDSNGRVAVKK